MVEGADGEERTVTGGFLTAGLSGASLVPPPHRATTAQLQAAYPFVSESGLGSAGAYIGRDLLGGAFAYDPWELYQAGRITSPNALVIGQIGRGKSALVKTYLWRELVFGRQAWIVDPKGEYGPLAEACGTTPIRLVPGGSIRLNPLDPPRGAPGDARRRQSELLASLAAASLGRALSPRERAAADLALAAAADHGEATMPAVVHALLVPSADAAASIHTDASSLASDGREVALELRRLVEGDLRGMFDGPTTPGLDLGALLVVLDLSAVYSSAALGLLMTCATAWLQAAFEQADGVHRIVVVDEAWAVLSDLAIARWLRASAKLSRAHGVATMVVVHRLSDLTAAGDQGSEQVRLARGLLADVETKIVYGQPPSEVESARELLGLSDTEAALLPRLPRGVALWKVGTRSILVEHRLGRAERAIVDTDARMVSAVGAPPPP
jgi:type IV secretory pathway VirB4 component